MQTLIFDTTKKQAILLNGPRGSSTVIESFRDVSTVKVNDMDRWVIYNANSGKALKSINYHMVDFAPLFTEIA